MLNEMLIFEKGVHAHIDEYLDQYEIDCGCFDQKCTFTLLSESTRKSFHKLRSEAKCPLHINSAYRCINHNSIEGGKLKSRHLVGFALDISFPPWLSKLEFINLARGCFEVVIEYPTFIHCHNNPKE
jgi:hypothetical protein